MGEIKQERCSGLQQRGDGGVHSLMHMCVGVDIPLAMHDAVVR